MMKHLADTLTKMAALHIKSREMLLGYEALYEELFLNLDSFITGTVFRGRQSRYWLGALAQDFGVEADDIRFSCLERCVSKLDLVLANPLEKQIPYLYAVCSSVMVSCFRKARKQASFEVSLSQEIDSGSHKDSGEHVKTYEDYAMDQRANTESNYIAKMQALEILGKYPDADSLLCAAAVKIAGDKPSDIAKVILSVGSVEKALLLYLEGIKEEFGIAQEELPKLPPVKRTGLSRLLSMQEAVPAKRISAKISNILNRTR